jgi:hypothetical protein
MKMAGQFQAIANIISQDCSLANLCVKMRRK